MAWATAEEVQAQWNALSYLTPEQLQPFVDDAVSRVVGVLGRKYAVTGWAGATPPEAKKWAKQLAYAYAQSMAHTGSAEESGDSLAKTMRDQVEAEMKEVLDGAPLLDENGDPLPINVAPSSPIGSVQTILLRTLRPVHTMDAPERSRVLPPYPNTNPSTSRWR
jgi:hypothetical protein